MSCSELTYTRSEAEILRYHKLVADQFFALGQDGTMDHHLPLRSFDDADFDCHLPYREDAA